ncbi:SLBB domain-containing protein [Terriglobus sp.]|uniref:SLBB domain-containing protein n=1 Tax=Terriglobus sp. TaxID=1889013 RepID=UPI003B002B44
MDGLFSGAQQQQQQSQPQDQVPVSAQPQTLFPSTSGLQAGPRTLTQQDTTVPNQQNQLYNLQNQRPLPVPPGELTGFQRLVAASVGKVLPIFGASLFSDVPSTFAPVDRIPVTPDYAIGPGDELLVHLWGQVNLDGRFPVDRSGNVYLPQIGAVHVAGIPFAQLTDYMKSQIGRNFRNFDLNVNIGQLRSIQVFVVGNAKRPGSYTISSLSTLVNALFASGGPTPMGSLRAIQVKRGNQTVTTFDFYDLLLRGDKSKDVPLLSGDVIFIPPAGAMVAVAGSVANPALYEIKQESTLQDLLGLAGGTTTMAQASQLRLERIGRQNGRSVLDVSMDAPGLATHVSNGDLILVSPIIDRFKDSVTLRGNVADPRRFAWFPGMHVKDLVPDKEALLTRDYWEQRNRLGLPVLDSTPDVRRYAPDAPVAQFYGQGLGPAKPASLFGPVDQNGNVALPDSDQNVFGQRVPYRALNLPVQNDQNAVNSNVSQTATNQNRRTQQDAANLQQYTTANAPTSQVGTLDQERSPSTNDIAASNVSLSAAVTGTARRFPAKNAVVLNAPDVDWAYAVIQRLKPNDLTTELLPFDLGKAVIGGDPSQNLALEPGDVITIFSKADIRVPQSQQTKYVQLEGEFSAAGTYSVKPGETLRQLVQRVGGFSKDAYIYGSQFTRESTRVIQQQRLNQYTAELERRVKLAEANSVNNALNPQDEVANIAGLQNARAVVMQLHQLSATGRIVLDVKPGAQTVADLPDLPLEDGDVFVVPQVPPSVDVFGSVYTQNSFLYDSRMRAGDYLRKAGGGTRTADTARSFIVRADGSVVSRQYSNALFAGSFSSIPLHPGDAIVVPERVDKRPLLRNLVDVATIIGQFGLGVAAINVLR